MKRMKDLILMFMSVVIFSSCNTDPQPISFGTDGCDFCSMTISDNRYGAELITKKGRIYKFDDLHCIHGFLKNNTVAEADIHSVWLVDYQHDGKLIASDKSFLWHNVELKTPMGSNTVALDNAADVEKNITEHGGNQLTWLEFLQSD